MKAGHLKVFHFLICSSTAFKVTVVIRLQKVHTSHAQYVLMFQVFCAGLEIMAFECMPQAPGHEDAAGRAAAGTTS